MVDNEDGVIFTTGGVVTECTARGNFLGIVTDQCSLTNCSAHDNPGSGFDVDTASVVSGCTSFSNDIDGFVVRNACLVRNNVAQGNLDSGIDIIGSRNTVQGNVTSNNRLGVRAFSSAAGFNTDGNLVDLFPTNLVGPLVGNEGGALSSANSWSNVIR